MKKRIFFGVATVFFALATMFNINMVQSTSAGDVSLESIEIMAEAQGEAIGGDGYCYPGGYYDQSVSGYIHMCGDGCVIKWQGFKGQGSKTAC